MYPHVTTSSTCNHNTPYLLVDYRLVADVLGAVRVLQRAERLLDVVRRGVAARARSDTKAQDESNVILFQYKGLMKPGGAFKPGSSLHLLRPHRGRDGGDHARLAAPAER